MTVEGRAPNVTPQRIGERWALSDTWLLEVFLGLYTLVWGIAYANPLSTTMAGNPAYAILVQFPGGENAFGAFAAALGAMKLLALVYGSRIARARVCAVLGVFWLAVTISIAIPTHWAAGGIPHFSLVALANWFVWVRMSQRGVDT